MAGCGDDDSGRPSLMADHPAAKGLAALRSDDAREALAWFDELVEHEPGGVPGHFLRVEALDRLGDRTAARAALLDLVTRFPFAEGAARERLAILALRDGDRVSAHAELVRATAAGWGNVDAVLAEPTAAGLDADPVFATLFASARANAPRNDE